MPIPSLSRRAIEAAADLLFPRSCVHCGDAVEGSDHDYLCRSCARSLVFADPPCCRTCGYPFSGLLAGPRDCPHCVELVPEFSEGRTLFLAKGAGRSLVHELKYHNGQYVLRDLTRIAKARHGLAAYLNGAVLVPVPLHRVKHRERGFNQSEVIAAALVRAYPGSCTVNPLLERVRFTRTQTRLNRSKREDNVKNAFALASGANVIPEQEYILVDDVFTTGSTLNACAAVLRKAGAEAVKVLTIGHG